MEDEYESDDQMMEDESGSESSSDEEMDDSIKIDARELQQALLDEEQKGTPLNDIKEFWTESSKSAISSPEEGTAVYTTYIYLLRRMGASVEELNAVFLEGKNLLSERFKDKWDIEAKYRRNFAYFLYTKAKQPEEALKLWRDVLSSGWDTDSYMWIEVANLERTFGNADTARTLLYKAINAHLNEPYALFEYFVQFEREEGTRQQVDIALEKINAHAARIANAKPKSKPQKGGKKERGKPDKSDGRKRKADIQPESEKFKKVVKIYDDKKNGHALISDKPKNKDADGFAIPILPTKNKTTAESTQSASIGPIIPSSIGPAIQSSIGTSDSTIKPEVEKTEPENPELTIFLSNIPFHWNADDIRMHFPTAMAMRIPHKTKELNKGFAFVDFGTLEDTAEALKLDGKLQAEGRNIQIFSYQKHQDNKKPDFKFATGQEKSKLFVRNVDFKSTEDELRELFEKHGELRDVRIVRHKNGKPKGVAFIEFVKEESAQNALVLHEYVFNGRTLEVHISDPSQTRRRDPIEKPSTNTEYKPVLGGGQARSRTTGFSFQPRVLFEKK